MDGWMDAWMHGWMDGKCIQSDSFHRLNSRARVWHWTQWHWDPGGGWMASQNQARCNSHTASAVSKRRTPFPNGKHRFQTADTVSKRVPRDPASGAHFQTAGAVSKRRVPFPDTVSQFSWKTYENVIGIIFKDLFELVQTHYENHKLSKKYPA
jgi:hypothetical protein